MPRKNSNAKAPHQDTPARRRIWRHNGFFGHARMMQTQCQAILHSDTTTAETKAIARRILNETFELSRSLKERVDLKC